MLVALKADIPIHLRGTYKQTEISDDKVL